MTEITDEVRSVLAEALLGLEKAYLERRGLTAELEVVSADTAPENNIM